MIDWNIQDFVDEIEILKAEVQALQQELKGYKIDRDDRDNALEEIKSIANKYV